MQPKTCLLRVLLPGFVAGTAGWASAANFAGIEGPPPSPKPGQGSTRLQLQERVADIWTFMLWQYGVPEFQPRANDR